MDEEQKTVNNIFHGLVAEGKLEERQLIEYEEAAQIPFDQLRSDCRLSARIRAFRP